MRRLLTLAFALCLCTAAVAEFPEIHAGKFGASPVPNPLTLPLAQSTTPIFTFLGSFKSPLFAAATGMSVSGSNLYVGSNAYNPANHAVLLPDGGIGEITIPALTGTPAYDGSNAAPACQTTPCTGSCQGTTCPGSGVLIQPTPPGSAPGSTWNPLYVFGNASGYRITGSLVSGGHVYVTGGTYYDGACNANKGWIIEADPTLTTWGAVNTVSGYPSMTGLSGTTAAQISRRYAGPLNATPALWQSLLGPAYEAGGLGLSILSCQVPIGFSFNTFDPATVSMSANNAVPITPYLDYFPLSGQGGQMQPGDAKQLSFRSFTSPTGTSGTYTLTAQPYDGPTSFTLTSGFPNNAVNGFYNATSTFTTGTTSASLVLAAPSGGWPATWAANYWVGGFIYDLTHDSGQGCRVGTSGAVTSASSSTMTVTCLTATQGSATSGDAYSLSRFSADRFAPYMLTFSDGEQRLVEMQQGNTGVPNGSSSTTFATINIGGQTSGCATGTCTATPLTGCGTIGSPTCTTSVTIAPVGDQYGSESDGPIGTSFIEPGSSSLLVISVHQFGPQAGVPLGTECHSGASSSNDITLPPDTTYYNDIQVSAYRMGDIYAQKNGTAVPVYTATPYATWPFPGWQNFSYLASGCVFGGSESGGDGWVAFDGTSRLYMGSYNHATGLVIINVYAVSSM